jgi:hypothetical protein
MTFSLNNRLILEQYVKEGLKSEVRGGIATPGQANGLKGLKVLIHAVLTLPDGPREIPVGSTAYIKEEILYNAAWAAKPLTCNTLPGKFMIVDLCHIEFFDIPYERPAA